MAVTGVDQVLACVIGGGTAVCIWVGDRRAFAVEVFSSTRGIEGTREGRRAEERDCVRTGGVGALR